MTGEEIVRARVRAATTDAISEAGGVIRAGGLVAFPTETVYGLGADATNGRAVAGIFEAKGRPSFNPLIVHVPELAAAEEIGVFGETARRLAEALWPGPLTLVVRRRAAGGIADLVTAGLETIGVRVPAHPMSQALLAAAGRPVAAPSANRSGRVSPTSAQHVAADLAAWPVLILDGGDCDIGVESTIIGCQDGNVHLLRPGGVARGDLETVLGCPLVDAPKGGSRPTAPGQLASHYAPRAAVRLDAAAPDPGEAWLAFGPHAPVHDGPMRNLSPAGDLREAAANLFSALRALDASGAAKIAVMPIPCHGLGEAINDRLRRAAVEN